MSLFTENGGLWVLLRDFYRLHPSRFLLIVVALVFSGVAGGFGLAAFLPVIEIVFSAQEGERSPVSEMVLNLLGGLGVGSSLGVLLWLIVLIVAVKSMLLLAAMLLTGLTTADIVTDLRMELIRSMLNARWQFFIEKPLGEFANSINSEASRSSQAFFAAFLVVGDFFLLLVYLALALMISWQVTLAAVLVSPLMGLVFRSLFGMARRSGNAQTEIQKSVLARVGNALQGMKAVKAMGTQDRLEKIMSTDIHELLGALRRQVMASQILKTQQETFIVAIICVGLYWLYTFSAIEMASLIGLCVLFYRTITQFASMQKHYQAMALNDSAYHSMRRLIDEASHQTDISMSSAESDPNGAVKFRDVYLNFGNCDVLKGVTLDLPLAGLVCIIGPSGSGKTSLVDLVAGLLTPTGGDLLVGQQKLTDLNLGKWRTHIGYVPQEMILFNDNVRNNVTLGAEGVPDAELWSALDRAGLKEVIEALPQRLDTQIGERGGKLSGGQRQRLSLARALVRNPRILILDEVTASLDPVTEQALAATLEQIAKSVLVLVVTHQAGVLRYADAVIRVQDGRVAYDPVRSSATPTEESLKYNSQYGLI